MSDSHDTQDTPEGKQTGFFERRWRMVKAAAKQAYEYLFDVKTYVYAAAMFGAVALVSETNFAQTLASNLGATNGFSGLFGLKPGAGPMDIALRAGQFVALSTMFRTGIAMAKESYACNDCHGAPSTPNIEAAVKKAAHVVEQQQEYSQYEVHSGYAPSVLPRNLTQPAGHKPPHQPTR